MEEYGKLPGNALIAFEIIDWVIYMTKDKINKSRRRLIQSAGTLPIAVYSIAFGDDHRNYKSMMLLV